MSKSMDWLHEEGPLPRKDMEKLNSSLLDLLSEVDSMRRKAPSEEGSLILDELAEKLKAAVPLTSPGGPESPVLVMDGSFAESTFRESIGGQIVRRKS